MKSITSILAVLALGTAISFAADPAKPKPDPAAMFKKLDTNNDGTLSKAEFMASPGAKKDPAKAEASFAKKGGTDTKGLTLEEYSAGGKKKNK
jgi:hypothetical protein